MNGPALYLHPSENYISFKNFTSFAYSSYFVKNLHKKLITHTYTFMV